MLLLQHALLSCVTISLCVNSFKFSYNMQRVALKVSKRHLNQIRYSCSLDKDTTTPAFTSSFLQESQKRGFLHQCTDYQELDDQFNKNIVSAYIGFDATGISLLPL